MKIDTSKLRALVKARGLTNTHLAAKAGITRQALQTMLREGHVADIRERTAKGLAVALRLADESLLSPDPLERYKQAVAEDNADLTFAGLGLPTTDPKSMDDIYVPVKVTPVPEREHDHDCPPADKGEERPIEESDAVSVDHCLALHRRVLLRGEPGSGKTTALRHAARAHAQNLPGFFPGQARLPLFVRLADFAKARESDSEMSLIRFVVTRTLCDASPDYWVHVERDIEAELKRGACLVLLDGLDEVGGDARLSSVLSSFVTEFGQNRFVLTSRIVGLDPEPWRKLNFTTFQVARWRDEDIREFGRRWYAARPAASNKRKGQLEQRAEELTTAIMNHRPLRAIAANPLMLTILAALHYANATLPRRRVDLYAKIVEVMLETWEANKRGARSGDPLHGILLEAREFGWLLERLALGMQREGRVLRPRWWVNDCVQKFLREQMALEGNLVKEQSERVIRYLCERTGLLVERGVGIFGFGHRTFQEYFASRGLLLEVEGGGDIVAFLRPYLFHPQWEEVVIYVAASLSAPRATTLLRVILDDPDPAGRFLRRGQQLALRCLIDGTAVADRVLLDQIFADGDAIGRSRWLEIAIGFICLLRQLLVTRHEAEAQRMLFEIEEAAKKELPERDYVAVYLSSHDPPDGPIPGKLCRKRLGGRQVELVWPARKKRIEDPNGWYSEVLKLVRDPRAEIKARTTLISLLGREEADSNAKARNALKKLLQCDPLVEIRAECADALEEVAATDLSAANLLLNRLEEDKSDEVRGQCAAALRGCAANNAEVRVRLEKLFTSGSEQVRAGAARGLSGIDFAAPDRKGLLDRFLAVIAASAEPAWVRCASIWAIASLLGRAQTVDDLVEECLADQNQRVATVALHVLADAVAEGRKGWSPALIGKIETMLMGISRPCVRLHWDLVTIVAMKETHGGRRLERLLGDALTPFGGAIRSAFVFGSVARREQVRGSDVDLMIIGDVRLKDLAAALHGAEQIVGRTVNPVLFSPERFREQYREGNPLLLDVVRKEKIFLKGSRDELTILVADGVPG